MGRNCVPEGKRDDQTHADLVVGHAGYEEDAVIREVDEFADILNIDQAGIERPDVNWEREFDAFSTPGIFCSCHDGVKSRSVGCSGVPHLGLRLRFPLVAG